MRCSKYAAAIVNSYKSTSNARSVFISPLAMVGLTPPGTAREAPHAVALAFRHEALQSSMSPRLKASQAIGIDPSGHRDILDLRFVIGDLRLIHKFMGPFLHIMEIVAFVAATLSSSYGFCSADHAACPEIGHANPSREGTWPRWPWHAAGMCHGRPARARAWPRRPWHAAYGERVFPTRRHPRAALSRHTSLSL